MDYWKRFICNLAVQYDCYERHQVPEPMPAPEPEPMPQPEIWGDVTGTELRKELSQYFPPGNIYIADGLYLTTNVASMERFLAWDQTNRMPWVKEWSDCDDRAFRLLGQLCVPDWDCLPCGFIWANFGRGAHAINLFCDCHHDLYYIEPQTDAIQPVAKLERVQLIVV